MYGNEGDWFAFVDRCGIFNYVVHVDILILPSDIIIVMLLLFGFELAQLLEYFI